MDVLYSLSRKRQCPSHCVTLATPTNHLNTPHVSTTTAPQVSILSLCGEEASLLRVCGSFRWMEVGEESRPDGLDSGYLVLVTPNAKKYKFPTGGLGVHSPYFLSVLPKVNIIMIMF